MTSIKKRCIIDSNNLSSEFYFTSILKEAYASGFLDESDLESIQLQCIALLAYKSEKYNGGESSSIRIETAESIMKSNYYTIGLYLKSLPDPDCAVKELKTTAIPEIYKEGRKLINTRFSAAKHLYRQVQKNKIITPNYTYNATLSDEGIGLFFDSYDPDYVAHEVPASIDYQLCNPVTDLAGVEFIQKYLTNIILENEFCRNFPAGDIHHLLCGYDNGYKDLLINIFEQVLTASLGCSLANRSVGKLGVCAEDVKYLQNELSKDEDSISRKISQAAGNLTEELNITTLSLRRYIEKSLPNITSHFVYAVRTNTLGKTLVSPVNPDIKPKTEFYTGEKMDDKDYRQFIEELETCRYSSDKLALIKEKVKSFGDLEDMLLDARLSEKEITAVLTGLEDVEVAALIKRHPYITEIAAVDMPEADQALRIYLKNYINQLPSKRQKQIFELVNHLVVDCYKEIHY